MPFCPRPAPPRSPATATSTTGLTARVITTPVPRDASAGSFAARFRAEVRKRPGRLLAACLASATVPMLIITSASARSSTDGATASAAADSTHAHGRGTNRNLAPEPPVNTLGPKAAVWMVTAREAAATCPGLPPEVLVAIGHVETRLGDGTVPSSAGARGPMQFLLSTWAMYGTDGNGDGHADIMNRADALQGAAALLCANGGGDPKRLRNAVWNYNRSPFYVDEVLRLAGVAG